MKSRVNAGRKSHLFDFRDNTGHEVDVMMDYGTRAIPIEIKLGKTVARDSLNGLSDNSTPDPKNGPHGRLIYGGDQTSRYARFTVVSYTDIARALP